MKHKKIIIVIGILLILIIGGIWVYALLHPGTLNTGIFARFGAGPDATNSQTTPVTPSGSEDTFDDGVDEESTTKPLQQLTSGPVAGAVFARNGVLYVEEGTGHIRYIDLTTGEETLISGTTVPGTYDASFSNDGDLVAITTTVDAVKKTIVAVVPEASSTRTLSGISLPFGAMDVNITQKAGIAYYLIKSSDGARGYAYSLSKKTSTELFSIPLADVHVLWGDPIYVYTTPTHTQTGYAYKLVGNNLRYVGEGGVGLMAFAYQNKPVLTKRYVSEQGNPIWVSSITDTVLGGPVIPEKCVSGTDTLFCAEPLLLDQNFPDSWYKGVVSFSDSLWNIDPSGDTTIVISDFFKESGTPIDVLKIGIDSLKTRLWFINKNDNTLWMYTLTQ